MKRASRLASVRFFTVGLVILFGMGVFMPNVVRAKAYRDISASATEGDPIDGFEFVGGGSGGSVLPGGSLNQSDDFGGMTVLYYFDQQSGMNGNVVIVIEINPFVADQQLSQGYFWMLSVPGGEH